MSTTGRQGTFLPAGPTTGENLQMFSSHHTRFVCTDIILILKYISFRFSPGKNNMKIIVLYEDGAQLCCGWSGAIPGWVRGGGAGSHWQQVPVPGGGRAAGWSGIRGVWVPWVRKTELCLTIS